jgi:hypothetical protein
MTQTSDISGKSPAVTAFARTAEAAV